MPTIDTPFLMELQPGEELKLARESAGDGAASAAPSANAFAKNDFQAWVSSIAFVEEEEAEADASTSARGHKHSVVRVSLVAHLRPDGADAAGRKRDRDGAAASSTSAAQQMKAVTLASCNFSSHPSASADGASAASTSAATRVESCVVFRAPLAFNSKGSIQKLAVVAEDMATTTGSSGSSGSVKRYQGARRFAVRLQGLQQTFLTKDQVLLLAKQ